MPIYEFKCSQCNDVFEELVLNRDAINEVACPTCESRKIEKKISSFAAKVTSSSPRSTSSECCNPENT